MFWFVVLMQRGAPLLHQRSHEPRRLERGKVPKNFFKKSHWTLKYCIDDVNGNQGPSDLSFSPPPASLYSWVQIHSDCMWRMRECLDSLSRTIPCLLHPPAFGSGSVWFQEEILRAAVEPYAGAGSSGLLLMHHITGPQVAGMRLQFLDDAPDAFKEKIHRRWISADSHFPPWWFWIQ